HALPVEQAVGGIEEAVTHADCGGFRPFPLFLRHLLTIQTDRSIVNAMNRQNGLFSPACSTGAAFRLARREAIRSFDMGYALSGKTALVTGANRGIGEAIVDALVAAGVNKVYAAARHNSALATPVARHGSRIVRL